MQSNEWCEERKSLVILIALVALAAGCEPGKTPKPKVEPPPAATATPVGEDPEVAREQFLQSEATKAAQVTFDLYSDARSKLSPHSGPVRYSGNMGVERILEVSAALPEKDVGFRSFEYRLDCNVDQPPTICAVARAFDPAKISEAARLLKGLETEFTEIVAVGSADGVWKPKAKADVYDGSCGESVCRVDGGGDVELRQGQKIESNETLACLRALCLAHASNLKSTGIPMRIEAKVAKGGARPEGRRAEIQFRSILAGAPRRYFWTEFQRLVGHIRSGQIVQ